MADLRVLIWDEQTQPQSVYPAFINGALGAHLEQISGLSVKLANLSEPEQGLSEAALAETDVLLWWGHARHKDVLDEHAERVASRVRAGMGLVTLHSAHYSKPFILLNGTPCSLGGWREDGEPTHMETLLPEHPIAAGIPATWEVAQDEMYDEPFGIPEPNAVIFQARWDKGEEFRAGCTWERGQGRNFYFQPGHETYPVYADPNVMRVIENGVFWVARRER